MESNKELVFEVMITFPHLLEKRIKSYNEKHGTDFEILEIMDYEVPFCKIGVSDYSSTDIFNLGYGLAALQYSLRAKGEIDW